MEQRLMAVTGDAAGAGDAPPPGGQSRWLDLDGPVHYLDFGGPEDGPVVVCVHGLGGSAVNWVMLAPLLAGRCRVLALDLAGHGLTRPAGRGTGVAANRALLHRFIAAVASGPVLLVGNSMGGMISLLAAAAAPDAVTGLVLVDPVLPFGPARMDPLVAVVLTMFALGGLLGLDRLMLGGLTRLPPELVVRQVLSLCCVEVARIPDGVVARHVEVALQRAAFGSADRELTAAARSVIRIAGTGGWAYRQAMASLSCPVLLLHGQRDRLVPVAAARATARRHPSWSLVVLPGAGHVPQLEAPGDCAAAITGWLAAELPGSAFLPAKRDTS